MPTESWWHGKTALVTGHTGFKGSWLSLWLQQIGADVVGYSLKPPTTPNLYELADVGRDMRSIEGDVADFERLRDVIADARPQVVFHLAAQSLVRQSYLDPVGTYRTNVLGTVHLLEAVRQVGCARVVVNVTSDKCYENREWVWGYRENDVRGGRDPYSNSKACADLVASAYTHSFFGPPTGGDRGVALATARAGNVIGGGDWGRDRLIPDVMHAVSDDRPAGIRHPDAIRPWQHVLDCLSGYLLLAEQLWDQPSLAGGWNFGPGEDDVRPVRWILERLTALWDGKIQWEHAAGVHPHEAGILRLDSSKARLQLGWQPRWDVERALVAVVQWYRSFLAGGDLRALTLAQLRDYQAPTA